MENQKGTESRHVVLSWDDPDQTVEMKLLWSILINENESISGCLWDKWQG